APAVAGEPVGVGSVVRVAGGVAAAAGRKREDAPRPRYTALEVEAVVRLARVGAGEADHTRRPLPRRIGRRAVVHVGARGVVDVERAAGARVLPARRGRRRGGGVGRRRGRGGGGGGGGGGGSGRRRRGRGRRRRRG